MDILVQLRCEVTESSTIFPELYGLPFKGLVVSTVRSCQ